ncbi:MAG: AbrB/MazE/SpoVT family DNA-binding domain-containing protein [Clostridia bacterium]|nr:AbrB/MazE/SpoVT family DNA-binding domain-containing protein [Clostridia bacterium]
MKSTGVVRPIDHLGRIVLPAELRRQLHLHDGTPMEFLVDRDQVILRKYQPGCVFCASEKDLVVYCGKPVCAKCRVELQRGLEVNPE